MEATESENNSAELPFGVYMKLLEIRNLHKKFRNRTLTFVSLLFCGACLVVGITANIFTNFIAIPIIILMYAVLKMCSATWFILKFKYMTNFSSPEIRNKITFTYELISGIIASLISVVGSYTLKKLGINQAFIIVGIVISIAFLFILKYMKTRIGLKPKEYKKEDIEMKELIKN